MTELHPVLSMLIIYVFFFTSKTFTSQLVKEIVDSDLNKKTKPSNKK